MEGLLCCGCKIDGYESEDLLFLWLSCVVSEVIECSHEVENS